MSSAERMLIWIAGGALATAAIGWVAFQIQQEGIAPAVLFPLAVGGSLGGALVALGRRMRLLGDSSGGLLRGHWQAVVVAVAWGLLAVLTQDYIGHRHHLRHYAGELAAQGGLLGPAAAADDSLRPSFGEHLAARYRSHGGWWLADLALTAGAAGTVVGWAARGRVSATEPETTS